MYCEKIVAPASFLHSDFLPLVMPVLPQVPPELYRALPLALAPILGNPLNLLAAGMEGRCGLQGHWFGACCRTAILPLAHAARE